MIFDEIIDHFDPRGKTLDQWAFETAAHSAVVEVGRRAIIHAHNAKLAEMYRMTNTIPSKQIYWKHAAPGFLETQAAKMGNFMMWISRNRYAVAKGTAVTALAAAGTYLAIEKVAPASGSALRETSAQMGGIGSGGKPQTYPDWMAPIIFFGNLIS